MALLSSPLFVLFREKIWLFYPVLYLSFSRHRDLGRIPSFICPFPGTDLALIQFFIFPSPSTDLALLWSFIWPFSGTDLALIQSLFARLQAQIWLFYPVLYLSFSRHRLVSFLVLYLPGRYLPIIITLAMEGRREPSLDRYMLLQECTAYLFDSSLTQCCHNRRFNFGNVLHKNQVPTLVLEPNSKN